MLTDCLSLTNIDFSNFDTQNLEEYEGIFNGLPSEGTIKYNSTKFKKEILNLLPATWNKEIIN